MRHGVNVHYLHSLWLYDAHMRLCFDSFLFIFVSVPILKIVIFIYRACVHMLNAICSGCMREEKKYYAKYKKKMEKEINIRIFNYMKIVPVFC